MHGVQPFGGLSMNRSFTIAAMLTLGACSPIGLDQFSSPAMVGVLQVTPEGDVSFGSVQRGTQSTQDVSMLNIGVSKVYIIDVYLDSYSDAAFGIASDLPLPLILSPDDEFSVTVFFQPNKVADFAGALTIRIDTGDGELLDMSRRILGKGV